MTSISEIEDQDAPETFEDTNEKGYNHSTNPSWVVTILNADGEHYASWNANTDDETEALKEGWDYIRQYELETCDMEVEVTEYPS